MKMGNYVTSCYNNKLIIYKVKLEVKIKLYFSFRSSLALGKHVYNLYKI